MTFEEYVSVLQTLKHAKNHLREQRGKGDLKTAIARNQAITLLTNAEFTLNCNYHAVNQ